MSFTHTTHTLTVGTSCDVSQHSKSFARGIDRKKKRATRVTASYTCDGGDDGGGGGRRWC